MGAIVDDAILTKNWEPIRTENVAEASQNPSSKRCRTESLKFSSSRYDTRMKNESSHVSPVSLDYTPLQAHVNIDSVPDSVGNVRLAQEVVESIELAGAVEKMKQKDSFRLPIVDLVVARPSLLFGESTERGSRLYMEDKTCCKEALFSIRTSLSWSKCIFPPTQEAEAKGLMTSEVNLYKSLKQTLPRVGTKESIQTFDFAAVFDGHGGKEVSTYLAQTLDSVIKNIFTYFSFDHSSQHTLLSETSIDTFQGLDETQLAAERMSNASPVPEDQWADAKTFTVYDIEQSLKAAFMLTDKHLPDYDDKVVGSTAVTALISENLLIVANVGDSRAVLSRGKKAYRLSRDHKPDEPDEEERIRAAGGTIWSYNGCRVMGLLAMTRAFGDRCLEPYGVTAEPEVTVLPRALNDDFLILASDGVWDVLTDDEACSVVNRCFDRAVARSVSRDCCCRVASTLLVKTALKRGTNDNVSVVVIDLAIQNVAMDNQMH